MIEFISANGYVEGSCDYLSFTISGGEPHHCFGDQVWISETEMEISTCVDAEVLSGALYLFSPQSRKALKGALRRMGVLK